MLQLRHGLLCTLLVMFTVRVHAADDRLWLPGTVNAVAVVRVADIYNSPLAKQEGWARQAAQNFLDQKAMFPPGASVITFGSELGLSPQLPTLREYGVVTFDRPVSLKTFDDLGLGQTEEFAGKTVIALPNGAFAIQDSEQAWRFTAPGGRQAGMRWVGATPASQLQLSPYLQNVTAVSTPPSHVLVALELSNAFSKETLVNALGQASSLEKLNDAARQNIFSLLAGVQGMALAVNAGTDLQAELLITFSESPSALLPVATPLLGDVLNAAGASLESDAAWKATIDGNAIVFRGTIEPREVRRILTLFHSHDLASSGASASTSASTSPGDPPAEPTQNDIAVASQKYFKEVETILADLRDTLNKNRDNHALWFERYGRKIDGLSLLNVDGDLLTFGQNVSSSLRYQGQVLRTANVRGGVRVASSNANNIYRTNSAYVGPYGGFYASSTTDTGANGNAIRAQEAGSAKGVQFSEWKQIEDGLVAIRRTLTERYRVEF